MRFSWLQDRKVSIVAFLALVCIMIEWNAKHSRQQKFNIIDPEQLNSNEIHTKICPEISSVRVPPANPRRCVVAKSWIANLHQKPCRRLGFSQGNQDCMLDAIFSELGTTNKQYVEFGFNTKSQCSASGPNTCKLWKDGWTGLLLDGDNQNEQINLRSHFLYASNIVSIFNKYKVPKELDFLSVDMDSHDFFVLDSILKEFRPRVITTEYNCNWPLGWHMSELDPTMTSANKNQSGFFFKNCIWGASASSWKLLLQNNGYSLIGVTPLLDLFWARNDILTCHDVPEFDFFVDRMHLGQQMHPQQSTNLYQHALVDTQVWLQSKNITKAQQAATSRIADMIQTDKRVACFLPLRN
jgi:hypothetical protein